MKMCPIIKFGVEIQKWHLIFVKI